MQSTGPGASMLVAKCGQIVLYVYYTVIANQVLAP